MFKTLGADVVGMTGVPEVPLARELGIHYAAIAFSINWAAGIQGNKLTIYEKEIEPLRQKVLDIFVAVLRSTDLPACHCR